MDYTNLIKACLKDHYSLSNINQLIDVTLRYQILNFLDVSSGYHHIAMIAKDIPKTKLSSRKGLMPIIRCPFGLKNVGATF